MSGFSEDELIQRVTAVEEEKFIRDAAVAHDKLVCWTTTHLAGLTLLQEIQDIICFSMTMYPRIALRHGVAQKLIEVAEAAGYSQEMCSYNKPSIGYAFLLSRGQLDVMPDVPVMPRPDFIWGANGCTASLHLGEVLGRILDVPVIGIDVPFEYDVAHRERFVDYVEGQLEGAMDFLETLTGRPFDWPRLTDRIRGLVEVADMRNAVDEAHKTCPTACNAFDLAPAYWTHRRYEIEESKRMFRELKDKIETERERREREQGAIPNEIRLTHFGGPPPWAKLGVFQEILARHGATLCTSNVGQACPHEKGEGLDPENPLRTVAEMFKRDYRSESLDTYLEDHVKPLIDGYNMDGVILSEPRTCKNLGMPLLVEATILQEKLGVPTLILEADMMDTSFFSEKQLEDRIGGFLEGIARRKAEVREGLQKKELGG